MGKSDKFKVKIARIMNKIVLLVGVLLQRMLASRRVLLYGQMSLRLTARKRNAANDLYCNRSGRLTACG